MKRLIVLFALLMTAAMAAPAHGPGHPRGFGISFGVFYSSLDPHGEWISVSGGMYAWRPHRVSRAWRPYFQGHWSWTDDGWYWVSDEPWAWAVYHYGRWYDDDYYGWIWIPGYDWAPAWVEWRYSGDLIGWAPLGPYAIFDMHFGVSYHRRWVTPYHYWSFVGMRHFGHPRMHRYIYRDRENRRLIGLTRSTGEMRYDRDRIINRGPDRSYVEQRTGRRMREANIVRVENEREQRVVRGNSRDEIRAYRPREADRPAEMEQERPARVRETERRPGLDLQNSDVEYRTRTMGDRGRNQERVEPPVRQGESERVAPPVRQREPERVAPPVRQSEPERVAPPVRQREPERVAPPVRQREPERVAPPVRQREPERPPDPPQIERRRESSRVPEQPRIERQREAPRERRVPDVRPNERSRNEGRQMERSRPERERKSDERRERGRR